MKKKKNQLKSLDKIFHELERHKLHFDSKGLSNILFEFACRELESEHKIKTQQNLSGLIYEQANSILDVMKELYESYGDDYCLQKTESDEYLIVNYFYQSYLG